MRESGVLLPVFSLASRFGIGCFSREAYDFVDFLYQSAQGFWQILPVGPTGYGDSPYQPFSAFAGNPYFVSPEKLIEDGLLTWDECNGMFFGDDEERVDYGALYENRFTLLRKAFVRFQERLKSDGEEKKAYEAFLKREAYWIEDYALFNAIKKSKDGASWLTWEEGLRKRDEKACKKAREELSDELDFICFIQYEFDVQWNKLKKYANDKNVKIIGDLPFYVSLDSADAWSHPEVFQMDDELLPKVVAGCPPDAFSRTGQLWGNPVYDWDALKKSGYDWWVKRIKRNYEFYDVIRVDHFHGFCEYYAIPYGDETAEHGENRKGPGMELFNALRKEIGELNIIAEDLGNNTPENEKLLKDSGFPGMKVLQYGFTSWDSYYVNHRHIKNCVVYTGTHDNTPTRAWIEEINDGERDFARRYINSRNTDYGQFVWDFIREAYRSVADLCIIPIQDYLCKGKEARINSPGTSEGNWQWRLKPNFLSQDLARSIRELSETYSRVPVPSEKKA
ncbi:MAG TPA: 4-alpha-glucanotransferase [Lachnospiraceae bacterium]|nr:4-alpha-glucanotransferase [Lachnospiraceae bacterium]